MKTVVRFFESTLNVTINYEKRTTLKSFLENKSKSILEFYSLKKLLTNKSLLELIKPHIYIIAYVKK